MKYDVLLKNCCLIDYATDFEGETDIAICDGVICEIGEELNTDNNPIFVLYYYTYYYILLKLID